MEYLHKKSIFLLLLVSLTTSIIGDFLYSNIESAKDHMLGTFIHDLSTLSFSLATVFLILYLMLRVIFKDYIKLLFPSPSDYYYSDTPQKKTKPKSKRGKK